MNIVLVWRKVVKDGEPYKGLGRITGHNYEYLILATKGNLSAHLKDDSNVS